MSARCAASIALFSVSLLLRSTPSVRIINALRPCCFFINSSALRNTPSYSVVPPPCECPPELPLSSLFEELLFGFAVPISTYSLFITGASGTIVHSTTVQLTVQ